ncbi:ubiquitin-fold modifier-conjugating enzyme 1 isoform X1 [Apteryx rowi]|uniref:ubiquitin-fold modifier-conjugating enzyme 1 isoform X1 n=1 Tax=Apteryx rowi TaxID=308060 RepID=UPI000E1D68AD|nr:ubiquitin-fold modifier-conjugating enzyme 1 isoform X1 [Apteryx rowi]
MADEATRKVVAALPLLRTAASPRDRELWVQRLKEEYQALIKYVENNKNADNDWFRLESNKEGTRWFGKCWYIHDLLKYEFAIEFDRREDLPHRAFPAPVGQERAQIRLGPSHGAGAGPLAGRGDPRPHRQGPGPAQGEMTGADPGPPPAGAGPSLRAIPTPSKSDSPIPRSSLPALFPPLLQ